MTTTIGITINDIDALTDSQRARISLLLGITAVAQSTTAKSIEQAQLDEQDRVQPADDFVLTWDARIHTQNKATDPQGRFKFKRPVDHALIEVVTAEQKAIAALPVPETPVVTESGLMDGPFIPTPPSNPVTVTVPSNVIPLPAAPVPPTIQPPTIQPPSLAPEPVKQMTDKATATYENYSNAGWTDAQLIAEGLMTIVEATAPAMTFSELANILTSAITNGVITNAKLNEVVVAAGFPNGLSDLRLRMDYAPTLLAKLGL